MNLSSYLYIIFSLAPRKFFFSAEVLFLHIYIFVCLLFTCTSECKEPKSNRCNIKQKFFSREILDSRKILGVTKRIYQTNNVMLPTFCYKIFLVIFSSFSWNEHRGHIMYLVARNQIISQHRTTMCGNPNKVLIQQIFHHN